jgi:hypothetical protein
MQRSLITKVLAWLCIGLAVNLCTPEVRLAQDATPPEQPGSEPADTVGIGRNAGPGPTDTTRVKTDMPELNDQIFPYGAASDSLSETGVLAARSVYRKWWLWTVAVVVVATTIVLYSGGKDEGGAENLPDFPDPPER